LLRISRRVAVVVVVATSISALAACSAPRRDVAEAQTTATLSREGSAFSGEVPEFSGPYAADFAQLYAESTSQFVRDVLQDGQISDAEYAEMTSNFASCLADKGITFDGFNSDGGFKTSLAPNGGDTHSIVNGCSDSAGEAPISALYGFLHRNPENLDWETITAACLVGKGVVPVDYDAAQFSQDSMGRFADVTSLPQDLRDALVSCSSDPLELAD